MKTMDDYREKAIKALKASFPHIKAHKHEQRVDKYIALVKKEVLRYWLDLSLIGNLAYVSAFEIRRNAGRYQLVKGSKAQTYISKWLDDNCALYVEGEKGNNLSGNLTQIKLNYDLGITAEVIYTTVCDDVEISDAERKDMLMMLYGDGFDALLSYAENDTVADVTEINTRSLKAYIDYTEYTYNNNKQNYNDKLLTRVKQAKRIYAIAKLFDGKLVQIISESDFGRKYYKGPNLQSVHKHVRHAALGDCIEFDIANSVYAWRYDLVKDIDPATCYAETLNYLEFKKRYREELAEVVFGDVEGMGKEAKIKIIKQAFTAISFGARGTVETVGWHINGKAKTLAINEIITASTRRKLFLEHGFVSAFIKEQELISKIIFDAAKDELKKKLYFKDKKRIKRNEALAYMYQHSERDVMDSCIAHIKEEDLLLVVHDAFYVKRTNADTLMEIKRELAESNSELKLEREEHNAYQPFDYEKVRHDKFIKGEYVYMKAKAEEQKKQ